MNDKTREVMFSTGAEEWETPDSFFKWADSFFPFQAGCLRVTKENTKCERFFHSDT